MRNFLTARSTSYFRLFLVSILPGPLIEGVFFISQLAVLLVNNTVLPFVIVRANSDHHKQSRRAGLPQSHPYHFGLV